MYSHPSDSGCSALSRHPAPFSRHGWPWSALGWSCPHPTSMEGATLLLRGCEDHGVWKESSVWPLWQAQLLDVVGWVFFSPPELPWNRVNPRGIEGSVPVRSGGFPQGKNQLRARVAGWVLASHSLHTPVCPRGKGIASQEGAAVLQRPGSCVPAADMPRPLGQAPALGRALFSRAIMGRELRR